MMRRETAHELTRFHRNDPRECHPLQTPYQMVINPCVHFSGTPMLFLGQFDLGPI